MRAIRLRKPGGLDNLKVEAMDSPPVGPGEVRVALHASSVNYHDYIIACGFLPVPDGLVPMVDGAGEVTEVGASVSGLAVGDRVIGTFFPGWQGGDATAENLHLKPSHDQHGYAREEIVAPASWFTPAPKGWSHAEAATLPCAGLTAWRALFGEAHLQPGETVLVQGTGGVSIIALQLAKAAGARVIATSSSAEKMERLRALGADEVINYREDEKWGATARKLTGGRGVDHVVEIGGAGTLPQSMAAVRPHGHISLIGVLAGMDGQFSVGPALANFVKMSGFMVGSREQQLALVRAVEANGIRPVIDRSFALEDLADAFRYQETGRHFGKIALEW